MTRPTYPRICAAPGCGRHLPGRRRRFCSDECRRRGQRAERVTETDEFGEMTMRMIATLARRVGASDIAEFGALWSVGDAAETAVAGAIGRLREAGFSWADLGQEIGQSKQGIQQWHKRRTVRSAVNTPLTTKKRPHPARELDLSAALLPEWGLRVTPALPAEPERALCRCGAPMVVFPGDITPTCSACRSLRNACECGWPGPAA